MAPSVALEVALKTVPPTGISATSEGELPRPIVYEDKYEEREYLKGRLVAAFRIFAKHGLDEGAAGHITLRDPVDPTTFWVNPFGIHFSAIKRSDLIQVDGQGAVIAGGRNRLLNTAAFRIHHAIHVARPDVICAAHSHSLYSRAFCALGQPLDMISQDCCVFYDDHVVFDSHNGLVLDAREGEAIAECLGDRKAALLLNHGPLTTGKTVEEAVYWFYSLDRCCHVQLLADAAAAAKGRCTHKIDDEQAKRTHDTVGTPYSGWFIGNALLDAIHQELGDGYLM